LKQDADVIFLCQRDKAWYLLVTIRALMQNLKTRHQNTMPTTLQSYDFSWEKFF
jgi:hypothetical protein